MGSWTGAGDLKDRCRVLELTERVKGLYEWTTKRTAWMKVTPDGRRNLFSSIGIGARNAEIVMRTQPISLYDAVEWRGEHLFLTSLVVGDHGRITGQAALVPVTECLARTEGEVGRDDRNRPTIGARQEVRFPGCVTETYAAYDRDESHGVSCAALVLVAPKAVPLLKAGDLVTLGGQRGGPYEVQAVHGLDPYKNEYEIVRKEDA